jgi:predicted dehydrogenase
MDTATARGVRDVGAAIVGPGMIGDVHAHAVRRVGAGIRAVVARTEPAARAARERYNAEIGTADLSQALSDPNVHVVHICTPNALHYAMAAAAVAAGKHVILEKPFTITVAEGRDLLERAEGSGRVHAICFNTRFYPLVQEAHERIRRGDLGEVLALRASMLEDGLLFADDWNWRLDPEVGGASVALSTIGCHLIDLVSFVIGDAVSDVCADLRTVHPRRRNGGRETEVDAHEVAHLMVRFARGARGLLAVSQAAAGRRLNVSMEIDGTRQALAWEAPDSNQLWIGCREAPNQIVVRDPALISDRARRYVSVGAAFREGFAETFYQLVTHVYADVLRGKPRDSVPAAYPTFHDGLAALRVHHAALDSARLRAWQKVEYSPEEDVTAVKDKV